MVSVCSACQWFFVSVISDASTVSNVSHELQEYWMVKAGCSLGILVLLEQDLVLIILCQ